MQPLVPDRTDNVGETRSGAQVHGAATRLLTTAFITAATPGPRACMGSFPSRSVLPQAGWSPPQQDVDTACRHIVCLHAVSTAPIALLRDVTAPEHTDICPPVQEHTNPWMATSHPYPYY